MAVSSSVGCPSLGLLLPYVNEVGWYWLVLQPIMCTERRYYPIFDVPVPLLKSPNEIMSYGYPDSCLPCQLKGVKNVLISLDLH